MRNIEINLWGLLVFVCYSRLLVAVPSLAFRKRDVEMDTAKIIAKTNTRSKIECGVACSGNKQCVSYTHDGWSCYEFKDSCGEFLAVTASACGLETAPGYTYDATVRKCYMIHSASDTLFADALANCQHDGGHLLRVHSEDLQQWIRQHLINLDSGAVFIDGMYRESRRAWIFDDGSKMEYFKWTHREPAAETEGTRIIICRGNPASSCDVKWKTLDDVSQNEKGYICEIDV